VNDGLNSTVVRR